MQAQGLFSSADPNLIRQKEEQARQANNLTLAQSSNPFASTMFTGLNLADELRSKTADVFGNPIPDSPAVAAAKEEKGLEEEVAKMVMEGRQQGKDNATIAQEVQQFLAGRGKFNKAEQYRTQLASEQLAADKGAAEIDLKKAQAGKENANAKKLEAEAAFAATSVTDRVAAIRARFPNIDPKVAQATALDKESFADMMVGKEVETAEGVFMVRPDGSKERIGSPTDRSTKVSIDNTGQKAISTQAAPELLKVQAQLDDIPTKLNIIDSQLKAVKTKPMITGSMADTRIAVSSALEALGVQTPENIQKIADTKNFFAAQKDLVLSDLNGKLGAGVSNTDRDFITAKFGELTDNPLALKQILERIRGAYIEDEKKLRVKESRLIGNVETGKVSPVASRVDTSKPNTAPASSTPPRSVILQDKGFAEFLKTRKKD